MQRAGGLTVESGLVYPPSLYSLAGLSLFCVSVSRLLPSCLPLSIVLYLLVSLLLWTSRRETCTCCPSVAACTGKVVLGDSLPRIRLPVLWLLAFYVVLSRFPFIVSSRRSSHLCEFRLDRARLSKARSLIELKSAACFLQC